MKPRLKPQDGLRILPSAMTVAAICFGLSAVKLCVDAINRDQAFQESRYTVAMAFLAVAAILFTIGVFGIFVNRKNIIVILMSIELILLSVNINLVAFSVFNGTIMGQVFAMLVLTVAAAEAAVGLAILVVYFRNRGEIAVEDVNVLRG